MPLVSESRIIVLHHTKYSDSSLIVHTVDSSCGRRSFLVRGVGKGRAGSAAARDFHPLNILDVVSGESPKSSLSYLREWTPVHSLETIRGDIVKSSIALFISEVIYRSFQDTSYDAEFFDWLSGTVLKLEAAQGSVANFHLRFLAEYCSIMGFRPAVDAEPKGLFSPEDERLIKVLLEGSIEEALGVQLSSSARNDFCRKMTRYLSYHLGIEIRLRSLDILHEIFA